MSPVPVPVPVLVLVLVLVLVSESVEPTPPPPPDDVHVQSGILTWSGASDGVWFSVQSQVFGAVSWREVSGCERVTAPPCDVSALLRGAEHGCVRLRVKGHTRGAESVPVEACATREDTCTPQVSVSAGPDSLSVHLSRSHSLWAEFADHAKHRVCVVQPGLPPKPCRTSLSSLTLSDPDLDLNQDQNRTVCVSVQFVHMKREVGLPRCSVCKSLPPARSHLVWVVPAVVLPGLGLVLVSAVVYILVFQRERIKRWLRPRPQPDFLRLSLTLEDAHVCSPTEEQCSAITGVRPGLDLDWTWTNPGLDQY